MRGRYSMIPKKPVPDPIRYDGRRLLRRIGGRASDADNDIDFEPDKLGRNLRRAIVTTLGPAIVDSGTDSGSRKRPCCNNNPEWDDDSKKSHPALGCAGARHDPAVSTFRSRDVP
jgi:hypothetical protein